VSNMEERRLGAYVVRIDRLICVGFGDCVDEAPGAFELDGEGIASFRPGADEVDALQLLEACRSCPVDALSVEDGDGRQIIP
jgi:ferredoxin